MTPSSSNQSIELNLNQKTYHIEIDDLDRSPLEVRVNGKVYQVTVREAQGEAAHPPVLQAAAAVAASPLPAAPTAAAAAPAHSAQEIRSPMPGNILDIAVGPGDQVTIGQPLCALEAMKMKSAIRSPREGLIATVHVSAGQVVTHGELLFTFE